MAANPGNEPRHGAFILGVLEGQRPGRDYTDREGNKRTRHEVGLRCGDDVIAVSYSSESEALEALAATNGVVGETVTLPVVYRLIKKLDGPKPYAFQTIEGDTGEQRDAGWR